MTTLRNALIPLLAALAMGAAVGRADARSIDDCEKIEHWDAYNKCLASFGPQRGQRSVDRSGASPEERGTRISRNRGQRGGGFIRRRGGRQFAVFDVGPSRPVQRQPRYRRR